MHLFTKKLRSGRRGLIFTLLGLCFTTLLCIGCTPKANDADASDESAADVGSVTPDPLTLLLIGAPELAPKMQRQWAARRDGQLTIVKQSLAGWRADGFRVDDAIDVVIYPPGLLAEMVLADRVLPIPTAVWESDD